MRARMLVVCGMLAITGCTDENALEGRYRLDLYNREDGCGFGWTPGGGFSTGLTIARYEDYEGPHIVAILGSAPPNDYFDIAGHGFGGTVADGELSVWNEGMVQTDSCYYFYSVEIRAEVRPNRFTGLVGGMTYKITTLASVPGCPDRCVSYLDLEGTRL